MFTKRFIYVAGVNTRPLAKTASSVPYWLLSVTLLKRKDGLPPWLLPYLQGRHILWDPGTITDDAISYQAFRRFITQHVRKQDEYLQYDEIGDPESTAWYLSDMRRRGLNPIPVLQPGGPRELLKEERVAIGGLVRMSDEQRINYLDRLFYPDGLQPGRVHLLGMCRPEIFKRYPALNGDSTTWIPRGEYNRRKSMEEWLKQYGEQDIPYAPSDTLQMNLEAYICV